MKKKVEKHIPIWVPKEAKGGPWDNFTGLYIEPQNCIR